MLQLDTEGTTPIPVMKSTNPLIMKIVHIMCTKKISEINKNFVENFSPVLESSLKFLQNF